MAVFFVTGISLYVNKLNLKYQRKKKFIYDLATRYGNFVLKLKAFTIQINNKD